jgi:hypothetical protein
MSAGFVIGHLTGKLVRAVAPRWANSWKQFMAVVLEPSIPAWEYNPYRSGSPFRLVRFDHTSDSVYDYYESDDLDEIVGRLAQLSLPQPGETCEIIDDNQQIVLGWQMQSETIAWVGCAEAFRLLEWHHDPLIVATWEAEARFRARGNNQTTEAETHDQR